MQRSCWFSTRVLICEGSRVNGGPVKPFETGVGMKDYETKASWVLLEFNSALRLLPQAAVRLRGPTAAVVTAFPWEPTASPGNKSTPGRSPPWTPPCPPVRKNVYMSVRLSPGWSTYLCGRLTGWSAACPPVCLVFWFALLCDWQATRLSLCLSSLVHLQVNQRNPALSLSVCISISFT